MFLASVTSFFSSCIPRTAVNDDTIAAGNDSAVNETQLYFLRDTSVRLLWQSKEFDELLKDTVKTLVVNNDYLDTMTEPEKAVIGYVSTFVRNNFCSNIHCSGSAEKLKPYLKLQGQSAEQNLNFLKNWFRNDAACLSRLENPSCYYDNEKEFAELKLTVKADTLKVWFAANETVPGGIVRWKQEDTFKLDQNNLLLIEEKQSKSN